MHDYLESFKKRSLHFEWVKQNKSQSSNAVASKGLHNSRLKFILCHTYKGTNKIVWQSDVIVYKLNFTNNLKEPLYYSHYNIYL